MEVVYYVACSVDGYIATQDGGVGGLAPFEGGEEDYGYKEFYSSIDALLIGSHTYEFALRQGSWMAPDRSSWVFTRRSLPVAHPSVTLTAEDPVQVLDEMKARGLKRAWLLGGGKLAASFRSRGLISRYMIAVVPTVLGQGIRVLAPAPGTDGLELIATRSYPNGIVQLTYEPSSREA
jgi:dihydrofolate reductase